MNTILLIATITLTILVLILGFFVLGALRAQGLLTWRLDQLEATRPARLGRDGLKVGRKAPDFTLPSVVGSEVSLHDYVGQKVLLVFTQAGCGPCHDIAPELNCVYAGGEHQVLVVNNGEPTETREWATETRAQYPVLMQTKFSLSKKYEIFATPFAYVIDEQGVIASSGIVGTAQYLGYVLSGAGSRNRKHHDESESDTAVDHASPDTSHEKELTHV